MLLAAVSASIVTRQASHLAYGQKKIGMVTPDVIERIPDVLYEFYEEGH